MCDDGGEPEDVNVEMVKMLDTDQAQVAKEILGKSSCDKLMK